MRDQRPRPSARALGAATHRLPPLALSWLIGAGAALASAPPGVPTAGPTLHLMNGGSVAGELRDSAAPGALRWRGAAFVEPFEFTADAVNAVHWPPPSTLPKAGGDSCFELAGGDVLFGSLVGLDAEHADLDIPRLGRLRIRRDSIHRIGRWRDGADLIYLGPNGLADWHEAPGGKGWRDESGQLFTDTAGAAIRCDVGLPSRAAIEFEISWKARPDFALALGVGEDEKTVEHAFRVEVWGGDLVVNRETAGEADVASVGEVAPGPGRVHLLAYLDQERGRLRVFSPSGAPLADLKVADSKPETLGGIHLANVRGDVRLERLRVSRWDDVPPVEAQAGKSRVLRADGSIVRGEVVKFDAAAGEFVVREDSGETRVAADRVTGVFLPTPEDRPRAVRAVYQDGARLSGDLIKVEGDAVWMAVPGVEGPLKLPVAGLRSLVILRHEGTRPPAEGGRSGLLEMEGVRLRGRLVDGREGPEASCLAWQPLGSATASPLRPGASGRIVYKEPTPTPATRPTPAPAPPPPGVARVIIRRLVGAPAGIPAPQSPRAAARARAIHLRTGDIIPSEVSAIDEGGVHFRTPLSESTFVPHDKVKAVELAPETAITAKLNKTKRQRLLMLPRMQKGSPPTHLIRSKNGDYLRGRVVGMDDKTLRVEVHLDEKDLPRDRISRIIWLHSDELEPSKDPAEAPAEGGSTRVQALRSDGIRLTFSPERFAGDALSGKSDVLGPCRVRPDDVDQLLIGGAIDKEAARLAYQKWKLRNAPEPRAMRDDGGPSSSGTESALVGKPAPDFALEMLGGAKFRLTESKGHVVVLDFWATWCGPCLQAMPQVDRVTREFRGRGVQLVAVNLEETPEQISAMLERHKLDLAVALDRDGVVAQKYAATAIPQTVVIDQAGNIARVFVGGGAHFDDQLREALRAVLPDSQPDESPQK